MSRPRWPSMDRSQREGGEGVKRFGLPLPRRTGIGIILMRCPCGCDEPLFVPFKNPLDGGPSCEPRGWERTGDTFETLTLSPSILRAKDKGGCGWHGFIRGGQVIGA